MQTPRALGVLLARKDGCAETRSFGPVTGPACCHEADTKHQLVGIPSSEREGSAQRWHTGSGPLQSHLQGWAIGVRLLGSPTPFLEARIPSRQLLAANKSQGRIFTLIITVQSLESSSVECRRRGSCCERCPGIWNVHCPHPGGDAAQSARRAPAPSQRIAFRCPDHIFKQGRGC